MPELPEVETVVRDLISLGLTGRRIVAARVSWARSIAGVPPECFRRQVSGRTVAAVSRRAKYIVMTLDEGWTLLVHLRMTGRLALDPASAPRGHFERAALILDDGRELRFEDSRKFGRVTLTQTPDRTLDRLGPEPLDRHFTLACFRAQVCSHRGMLKPLLLNQEILAGLGNIYVDEALWDAGLHPETAMPGLSPAQQRALYEAIRRVLRRGIRAMGTSLGEGRTNFYSVAGRRGRNQDGLRVFRRTGEPCPRCGTAIVRLRVSQRGTHICPACQSHQA